MYNFPVTRRLTGTNAPRLDEVLLPLCLPVPAGPAYVALPGALDPLAVGVAQVADDATGYACAEHAGRDDCAWQHHGAGRDQRPGADPGTAEHDRAHADQCAFFYVSAVHGRVVTQADPSLEPGRLAGVDVKAAQVLDVALRADEDLVIVGAEHGVVPDAGVRADGDRADDHGAGGDPGAGVDRRLAGGPERSDEGRRDRAD